MNNIANKALNIGRICCIIFGIFCLLGSICLMYSFIASSNSEYFFNSIIYLLSAVMMLIGQYMLKMSNDMMNDIKII